MKKITLKKLTRILDGYRKYHLEIRHLTILVFVLIAFQFIILYMNQRSLEKVFVRSQQWYQQDAAERIANLTSTALEMLLESKSPKAKLRESEIRQIIQDFNIIFSQQLLDKNVQSVCILIPTGDSIIAIDDGQQLFDYVFGDVRRPGTEVAAHAEAIRLFKQVRDTLRKVEQTFTLVQGQQVFHVFVPFVPRGEFVGAVYMKNAPDLSFLTQEMSSSYDQTALVYSGLIIIGLIAMFFVSSRTLAERNEAQQLLFEEQKRHLAEQINHEKELLFTKRIYHTHHKAEKIGGFIKEDLRTLTPSNIGEIKHRIGKYASFIARVIYDMKWYDPPIHTIRGGMFRTNINDVIRFIVENIFQRVSDSRSAVEFDLRLDPALPEVAVNEFVLWEVLEPIIQNCLDHAGVEHTRVTITTCFDPGSKESAIIIADNGKGLRPGLLEQDDRGLKRVFLEHVTAGSERGKEHSGYGCYIAHELATQRLGWKLDADNPPGGGSAFTFKISHGS